MRNLLIVTIVTHATVQTAIVGHGVYFEMRTPIAAITATITAVCSVSAWSTSWRAWVVGARRVT